MASYLRRKCYYSIINAGWQEFFEKIFLKAEIMKDAMIIDTHAHYDDEAFDEDRTEILEGMKEQGVGTIINAAASMDGCRRTLELTGKFPIVFGMLGVHPDDVGNLTEADMDFIKKNAAEKKIVAIGEIGLDYHWDIADRKIQKHWFIRQMEVAREAGLPICVHSRDAAEDTLMAMKEAHAENIGGVIHCYSYSREFAREFLDMGFYFGIGGVVTFKNGRKCKETVEMLPMDKIILETDAPYLAPEPFRGRRNNSAYLSYVAEKIAEIKGISKQEVIEKTSHNACTLYKKLV